MGILLRKFVCSVAVASALSFNTVAWAQEREWLLDAVEEDVFLVFGVPSSNDVGVSFWCKVGSKNISLFSPLPPNTAANTVPVEVEIKIGADAYKLKTKPVDSEDADSIEAILEPREIILQKLTEADRFSVALGSHVVTYPLAGADFPGLSKLCNNPPLEP